MRIIKRVIHDVSIKNGADLERALNLKKVLEMAGYQLIGFTEFEDYSVRLGIIPLPDHEIGKASQCETEEKDSGWGTSVSGHVSEPFNSVR